MTREVLAAGPRTHIGFQPQLAFLFNVFHVPLNAGQGPSPTRNFHENLRHATHGARNMRALGGRQWSASSSIAHDVQEWRLLRPQINDSSVHSRLPNSRDSR